LVVLALRETETEKMINLDLIIKSAKANTKLVVAPGQYSTAGTLIIPQDGLDIDFTGVVLASVPKTGALFVPTGKGQTIRNLTVLAGPVIFNPQGPDFTVESCFIGGSLVGGKWVASAPGSVEQAVKTGPNGTGFQINNSHVGHCTTVAVYCDRDGGGGTNTTIESSVDEYCLRLETSDGKTIPAGGTWMACTFNGPAGDGAKDAVGVRMHGVVSAPVVFLNCLFTGNDLRIAQSNQAAGTKPGQFAVVQVTGCTFSGIPGKSPIAILQGGKAQITGCVFEDPADPPMAADSMSETMFSGNTQKISKGGKAQPWFTSPHGGDGVDGGENTIIQA